MTVHNIMSGHKGDQKSKKSSSPLWTYNMEKHSGIHQLYITSLKAGEKKIVRLNCLEALNIERKPQPLLVNTRQERGRGGVVRIPATQTG